MKGAMSVWAFSYVDRYAGNDIEGFDLYISKEDAMKEMEASFELAKQNIELFDEDGNLRPKFQMRKCKNCIEIWHDDSDGTTIVLDYFVYEKEVY